MRTQGKYRRLAVLGSSGVIILAAVATAGLAATPAAASAGASAVGHAGTISQRATLAYWTAARLRSAKPVDIIAAGSSNVQAATGKPSGKPGTVPGGLPSGQTAAAAAAEQASATPSFTYPFPYDSFTPPLADWKKYPWEVNGKLFFANNGGNFVCSATAVGSSSGTSNENEIWTAGHCLVNTLVNNQVVDSSAEFIPAYNGAKKTESKYAPFGIFTWTGSWETSSAWFNSRDVTEDEAAMTVNTSDTTGRTLGNSVGWDGFAWNQSVNQQFVAFGYPAGSPYNGNSLIEDIAATAGQDGSGGANPVNPIVIGSPMTGGSSGGAWNIDWSDSGPGFINGHNDYIYTSQPLGMYSPYQDSLSNTVRCFGATSC